MTLNIQRLRDTFDYDPETGVMTYKRRVSSNTYSGKIAGSMGVHGYYIINFDKKPYRLHRLIWAWMTGSLPDGIVDHIDRNRANNKWNNLRVVSPSANVINCDKSLIVNTTTGVVGVRRRGNSFSASIGFDGKRILLGSFSTLEEAVQARKMAEQQFHDKWCKHE